MEIVLTSVFLIPLFSLLALLFMSGCTLLAILWENSENSSKKRRNRACDAECFILKNRCYMEESYEKKK